MTSPSKALAHTWNRVPPTASLILYVWHNVEQRQRKTSEELRMPERTIPVNS